MRESAKIVGICSRGNASWYAQSRIERFHPNGGI